MGARQGKGADSKEGFKKSVAGSAGWHRVWLDRLTINKRQGVRSFKRSLSGPASRAEIVSQGTWFVDEAKPES